MSEQAQPALFSADELQTVDEPAKPFLSIYVHFETVEDMAEFGKLIGFPVSTKTRVLPWPLDDLFPDRGPGAMAAMNPEAENSERNQP